MGAGITGDVQITFEETTQSAWLYDLLQSQVSKVVVCNPRKNALLKVVKGQIQRSKKPVQITGLNFHHNHELKNIFKGAATTVSVRPGPLREYYERLIAKGMQPEMARLTLARKIATIALILWRRGERFDATELQSQAA